jgi:hypothetical protein
MWPLGIGIYYMYGVPGSESVSDPLFAPKRVGTECGFFDHVDAVETVLGNLGRSIVTAAVAIVS